MNTRPAAGDYHQWSVSEGTLLLDQVARRPQDGGDGFGVVGGEGKGRGGDSGGDDLDGKFNVGIEDSDCGGCVR